MKASLRRKSILILSPVAQQVWREYDFAVTVPAGTLTDLPDAVASEQVLVQGIADCVFREGDHLVLVDYKTDSHSDEETLSEDYSFQLKVYEEALETAFAKPVKEKYIYSFGLGETVTL